MSKNADTGKKKKALLVTRVSGFIPQFEMNNVKILQEMGYDVRPLLKDDTVFEPFKNTEAFRRVYIDENNAIA